jgi:hypothetical protein
MDTVAEYAARYGTPRADMSWHEMLALVRRTGRFEMRDRLIQSQAEILSRPVPETEAGVRVLLQQKYERIAWPEG